MVSGHKKKHRQMRQELNEKRRLRRAKKALDAEAKGLRKRGLNMRMRELLHKANGEPLAKEVLETCMLRCVALSEHYYPLDQDGNRRMRVNPTTGELEPVVDLGLYLDLLKATARFAAWLAPYQSPKLRAIALDVAPTEIKEESSFTLSIFNARSKQVSEVIDREEAERNEQAALRLLRPDKGNAEPTEGVRSIGDIVGMDLQEVRKDDQQTARYQPNVESIAPPRIEPGR
jgi:hypothetical protein